MFKRDFEVRVRYSETDKMGYVYYGNYATYFEVARVEMIRALGLSYAAMEKQGVMLPVLEFRIKYYKPAYYDDLLTITTTVSKVPQSRIEFDYQTRNEKGELLNEAYTSLVFVDVETGRPCRAPKTFLDALEPYFKQ